MISGNLSRRAVLTEFEADKRRRSIGDYTDEALVIFLDSRKSEEKFLTIS